MNSEFGTIRSILRRQLPSLTVENALALCDELDLRLAAAEQRVNELEHDKLGGWIDSAFQKIAENLGFESPNQLRLFVKGAQAREARER